MHKSNEKAKEKLVDISSPGRIVLANSLIVVM